MNIQWRLLWGLAMTAEERLARIALIWSEAVGPAGLQRLLDFFGSAQAAIGAAAEDLAHPELRLRPEQIGKIRALPAQLERYKQLLEECDKSLVRVVLAGDEEYPPPLRGIPSAPPVMSIFGRWIAGDDPAVAIVGTRQPTDEGLAEARRIAEALARRRITVVSGMARGIDAAAHRGAMAGLGRTIAVLGCGLLNIRPYRRLEFARRIASDGAVMSETHPLVPPSTTRLVMRNRIISGLARVLVVVQSRNVGGALIAAQHARRQGRVVFAVQWPGSIPQGEGCRMLLEQGARPLEPGADIQPILDALEEVRQGPSQLRLFGSNAQSGE